MCIVERPTLSIAPLIPRIRDWCNVEARHFRLRDFRPTITWATEVSPNLHGCLRIAVSFHIASRFIG